jgi:hypothetical protein
MITKKNLLYLSTILFSILLSIISIINHPVFNPDGIVYIWSAYLYQAQGLAASMHAYNWPLYPMSLVWLHQLTGLSFLYVGYIYNIVFSSLICLVFIKLTEILGGSFKVQCWAACVILVWHELNGLRDTIIRDQGYWFFLFLGFCFLLKLFKKPRLSYAFLWSVCTVIATLYRIDGLVILLFLPLIVFSMREHSFKNRIRIYLLLNIMTVALGVSLLIHLGAHRMSHTGRLGDGITFLQRIHQGEKLSVFSFYLPFVAHVLSWAYGLVLVYTLATQRFFQDKMVNRLIIYFVFLNVVLTLVSYFANQLLADRYVVALALALLLFVPKGLMHLYQDWSEKIAPARVVFPVVFVLMSGMLISAFYPFGPSHRYIAQAAWWVKAHTKDETEFYTNSAILRVLAEPAFYQYPKNWVLFDAPAQNQQYAVYVLSHQNSAQENLLIKKLGEPIKTFHNQHGDMALIFK